MLILSILTLFVVASPLHPVKTDTPRDTMKTFISAMDDYASGVKNEDPVLTRRLKEALRCLADPDGDTIASEQEKTRAAIFLKETIDRVIVIDYSLIPVAPTKTRWRLKNTEIVLRPQNHGDREGEWLITHDTWKRAKSFYKRIEKLPYLEGGGKGALYHPPVIEKYFPSWAQEELFGQQKWQWMALFGLFFTGFFLFILISKIIQLMTHMKSKLLPDNRFQLEIGRPISFLLTTLFWYASFLWVNIDGLAFRVTNSLILLCLGFSLVWIACNLINLLTHFLKLVTKKTESPLDDQLVPLADKSLKVLVSVLGGLIVLQNMGINVFSLVAGLGLGGLAFALAAKDTAANLFGSIMILVDRPFKVGDWIHVDGVEGNVEEIGFRSTRVRTFYNSLITVPNSAVATAKIDNYGERKYRRNIEYLGVNYKTTPEQLESFLQGIRNILLANPNTRKDYFNVVFKGYQDSSLQIMVYFFLIADSWYDELIFKQNILIEIYRLANELKVDFAFPTQSLYMEKPSDGSQKLSPQDLTRISQDFGPNGPSARPKGLGIYDQS